MRARLQSRGWVDPINPPQQFPPSCHLSSLFSPSPEWILLILSTLALEGGTLLAGLPPGPLHLPYLRHCPAPLLHVPARIHCTITPQMFTDMPFRFCGKGYGWYSVKYILKLKAMGENNFSFFFRVIYMVKDLVTSVACEKWQYPSVIIIGWFCTPKIHGQPLPNSPFPYLSSDIYWLIGHKENLVHLCDKSLVAPVIISWLKKSHPCFSGCYGRDNWQRLIPKKKKQRGIVAPI